MFKHKLIRMNAKNKKYLSVTFIMVISFGIFFSFNNLSQFQNANHVFDLKNLDPNLKNLLQNPQLIQTPASVAKLNSWLDNYVAKLKIDLSSYSGANLTVGQVVPYSLGGNSISGGLIYLKSSVLAPSLGESPISSMIRQASDLGIQTRIALTPDKITVGYATIEDLKNMSGPFLTSESDLAKSRPVLNLQASDIFTADSELTEGGTAIHELFHSLGKIDKLNQVYNLGGSRFYHDNFSSSTLNLGYGKSAGGYSFDEVPARIIEAGYYLANAESTSDKMSMDELLGMTDMALSTLAELQKNLGAVPTDKGESTLFVSEMNGIKSGFKVSLPVIQASSTIDKMAAICMALDKLLTQVADKYAQQGKFQNKSDNTDFLLHRSFMISNKNLGKLQAKGSQDLDIEKLKSEEAKKVYRDLVKLKPSTNLDFAKAVHSAILAATGSPDLTRGGLDFVESTKVKKRLEQKNVSAEFKDGTQKMADDLVKSAVNLASKGVKSKVDVAQLANRAGKVVPAAANSEDDDIAKKDFQQAKARFDAAKNTVTDSNIFVGTASVNANSVAAIIAAAAWNRGDIPTIAASPNWAASSWKASYKLELSPANNLNTGSGIVATPFSAPKSAAGGGVNGPAVATKGVVGVGNGQAGFVKLDSNDRVEQRSLANIYSLPDMSISASVPSSVQTSGDKVFGAIAPYVGVNFASQIGNLVDAVGGGLLSIGNAAGAAWNSISSFFSFNW